MATSSIMSLPLSLLFVSLILVLTPATKADIAVFSAGHFDDISILTTQTRRTRINGGESLTDGSVDMEVKRDCSIFLFNRMKQRLFSLPSDLPTRDCYVYVSNRGELLVHANDLKIADKPIFGKRSEEGRYALVLHGGSLAIYGPAIWSNDAGRKEAKLRSSFLMEEELPSAISASAGNVFHSGDKFEGSENGDVEVARERHVTAFLRPDCTLAVQHKSGKVIWSTWTDHTVRGQCKLELKSNGQLVIRDYIDEEKHRYVEVFNSEAKSRDDNSYICLLWVEGELMIYGRKDFIYEGNRPIIEMVTQ